MLFILRKFIQAAMSTKSTRRKSWQNSTKVTHNRLLSIPSPKALNFNHKIVRKELEKVKTKLGILKTESMELVMSRRVKVNRHGNHQIHHQPVALRRQFHHTPVQPASQQNVQDQ